MGKPYSMDLRERAVGAVERGELSRQAAARRFGVAASTVVNWLRRLRETRSLVPGQTGGHKPKAIRGAHGDWLVRRIKAGDFTLRGLVAELAERGLKVDYRSVWAFVHAEQLSFKKTVVAGERDRRDVARRCARDQRSEKRGTPAPRDRPCVFAPALGGEGSIPPHERAPTIF
jgi:transposase